MKELISVLTATIVAASFCLAAERRADVRAETRTSAGRRRRNGQTMEKEEWQSSLAEWSPLEQPVRMAERPPLEQPVRHAVLPLLRQLLLRLPQLLPALLSALLSGLGS